MKEQPVVAINTPKTPALTELEATLFRLVDALVEHGRNYPARTKRGLFIPLQWWWPWHEKSSPIP